MSDQLPAATARILELGCGNLGGFVPRMRALGHAATGVDPDAPEGPEYDRIEFEQHEITEPVDVIVACTSLHHVANLREVLDRINAALEPAGTLVVVEWAHERFDQATARWCFDRLGEGETWLHAHRDRWRDSGQHWDRYFQAWANEEHLRRGSDIIEELRTRFVTRAFFDGPLFFADLDGTTRADEQAAIDAGIIQSAALHYVGLRRE